MNRKNKVTSQCQGQDRVTCAHWGTLEDGRVGWCSKPAIYVTLCNPKADWKFSLLNIGHYYCLEHKPEYGAHLLPEREIVYWTQEG